jgi:hypothetical protein
MDIRFQSEVHAKYGHECGKQGPLSKRLQEMRKSRGALGVRLTDVEFARLLDDLAAPDAFKNSIPSADKSGTAAQPARRKGRKRGDVSKWGASARVSVSISGIATAGARAA